jgi:hypothetical protein
MADNTSEVPAWLLNDLNLTDGAFDEAKTAVIGRPNAHLRAVLDTGNGPPAQITARLNEEQQKRLGASVARASG